MILKKLLNTHMAENHTNNNYCINIQHTLKEGNMSDSLDIEKAKKLQNSIEAVGEAYREEISNLLDRIRQDQRDFTLAVADLEANNTLLRWDEVNLHYRLGQLAEGTKGVGIAYSLINGIGCNIPQG